MMLTLEYRAAKSRLGSERKKPYLRDDVHGAKNAESKKSVGHCLTKGFAIV